MIKQQEVGQGQMVQLLGVSDSVSSRELLPSHDMEMGEPDTMFKSKGALKVWDWMKSKLQVNG